MVFVVVFTTRAISRMKFKGGGRAGGDRVGVGGGGKPKAGNTIHKEVNSSAVSSVGHRLPQST